MILKQKYNQDKFTRFIEDFVPDVNLDEREIQTSNTKSSDIEKACLLGESKELDLKIFEIKHTGTSKRRVGLTMEGFRIMKKSGSFRALIVFYSDQDEQWRFSLMTLTPKRDRNAKLVIERSSPKRYSFLLGPDSKTGTPENFLISKGSVKDFEDLQSRFSLEVVNKDFYRKISELFIKLVGDTTGKDKNKTELESLLKLPSVRDKSQTSLEFAVRLIGRVIFCWFLREKKSESGKPLMPYSLLSLETVKSNKNYYHEILEPIFFEVLNKPIKERKEKYTQNGFNSIPYLNGGLFTPHDDDFFDHDEGKQTIFNNTVKIPDEWLGEFFEFLETYNFTIDENISFDEELSIDPEMLGRIFENLLAEISPGTGESARKNTGSYYTPRTIVDYMVDESLYVYLKNKTNIEEEKLWAVISYDLMDDLEYPLSEQEQENVTESLHKIKILDPACGSGAFPMGMLQKIVFILQQTDPDGKNWFKRQIQQTTPEIRRAIEREFKNRNFDYIRKLGIIRENIFGVDIQPIATEISRLRCFLTLVVDESINDSAENRGIEPLPNLDFKFVTANALIGLPQSAKSQQQTNLFEDETGISELQELRDVFFNSTGVERDKLKFEFVQVQKKMLDNLIQSNIRGHAELTSRLINWNPFNHEASDWFDPEWMFGVKDGFDVVIANPPYGANIDRMIDQYRKDYSEVIKNYADIYKIFFGLGLKILKKDGVQTYITPNTYLTQPRYRDLRGYLLNFNILQVLNLGENVFDAGVVPVCISIIQKSNKTSSYLFAELTKNGNYIGSLNNIEFIKISLEQVYSTGDISLLQSYSLTGDELIANTVLELKDAGIQYHRSGIGLKNKGGNDLYERLFSNDPHQFKNTIPVWYGKLVDKYFIEKNSDEFFNLDYKTIIRKKESVSFTKEATEVDLKILWRQTAPHIIATIDTDRRWFRNTLQCGWIRQEYKNKLDVYYILGLFNSSYFHFLYRKIVNETAGRSFPQVKLTYLKKLPIKITEISKQKKIANLVKNILEKKAEDREFDTKEIESQIDQLVYKLYGLTEEEIEIVENHGE